MNNYKIIYHMTDGSILNHTIPDRAEDLQGITDLLTKTNYLTHIDIITKNGVVINSQNIVYMEVLKV